jgi:phage shock protein PspC (stress-responsive transcriptional regulator)
MEQTPGQQDPGTSGAPAEDVPPGEAPASTGETTPPGWGASGGGAAAPPPWGAVPPSGGTVPPARRLYRLRNDRVVAGVAAGLAAYLQVDPVWIRLAFVALTPLGLGVLLYIVAWVVMPPTDVLPYPVAVPPVRRLHRLSNDRVVAGVAAGLGAQLEVDPMWIRLAFFILAFVGGLGVLLYIACWVLMPAADAIPPAGGGAPAWSPGVPTTSRGTGADLRIIAGAFFLIVAVIVLANNFNFVDSGLVWGAVLICVGVLFLVGEARPSRYASGPPPASPDPAHTGGFAPPPPVEPASPAAFTATPVDQPYPPRPAYTPPVYTPYSYQAGYAAPAYAAPAAWTASPYPPSRVRLGTLGLAAVILALGVALLLQSAGVVHLTAETGFGIVFVVLGLTMVVGARFGRAGGLLALAICLLPFAAAAVLVPEPLTGGVGNVSFAPQTVSTVQPAYHLIAGQMYVDLSELEPGSQSVSVTSTVAFGHLVVVVPADTTVDLTAKVGAGEEDLLGRIDSGVQISSQLDAATGPAPAGTLQLNVSVGCGQLTVMTGDGVASRTEAGATGQPALATAADRGRLVEAR